MPGGDKTGPHGAGPMSGRGAGFCAGYEVPGYANPAPGRGYGMGIGGARGCGFGVGRGRRHMLHATGLPGWMRSGRAEGYRSYPAHKKADPEMEKRALQAKAEALQAELDAITRRLGEFEKEP